MQAKAGEGSQAWSHYREDDQVSNPAMPSANRGGHGQIEVENLRVNGAQFNDHHYVVLSAVGGRGSDAILSPTGQASNDHQPAAGGNGTISVTNTHIDTSDATLLHDGDDEVVLSMQATAGNGGFNFVGNGADAGDVSIALTDVSVATGSGRGQCHSRTFHRQWASGWQRVWSSTRQLR